MDSFGEVFPERLVSELISRSLGHDAAALHDADVVGSSDRFSMMADGEDSTSLCERGERSLDFCFTVGVGGGGGFVKNEDGGVDQ